MYNIEQLRSNVEYSTTFKKSLSKKMKTFIIFGLIYLALLLATLPYDLYSQSSGGGYSGGFLFREVGARASSMGGAYTAVANEPNAIFYNPAGLGVLPNTPLLVSSISTLSFGRTHTSLAWGQAISSNIGMGFGLNSIISQQFQGRDIRGVPTATLRDHEYSMNLGFAYSLDYVSMGGAMKFIRQNLIGIDGYYSNGFAFDLGSKFNVMEMFTVGIAVQNIGSIMLNKKGKNLYDVNEQIPFSIKTGIAMEFGLNEETYSTRSSITGELEEINLPATNYVLIDLDFVVNQFQEHPNLVLGAEAVLHEMFAVRGGMSLYGDDMGEAKFMPMNYWGGGFSIRPDVETIPFKFHIDYSISKEFLASNGVAHNFSLVFEF